MHAASKAQRKFFGMVHSYKQGKLKHASKKVAETSRNVTGKTALEFARKTQKEAAYRKPKKKRTWVLVKNNSRKNLAKSLA